MYVDGNMNDVTVKKTDWTCDGLPVVIAYLCDGSGRGYLAVDEGAGGFGDEACPSSYGMSCITWFGRGEAFPAAVDALMSLCVLRSDHVP